MREHFVTPQHTQPARKILLASGMCVWTADHALNDTNIRQALKQPWVVGAMMTQYLGRQWFLCTFQILVMLLCIYWCPNFPPMANVRKSFVSFLSAFPFECHSSREDREHEGLVRTYWLNKTMQCTLAYFVTPSCPVLRLRCHIKLCNIIFTLLPQSAIGSRIKPVFAFAPWCYVQCCILCNLICKVVDICLTCISCTSPSVWQKLWSLQRLRVASPLCACVRRKRRRRRIQLKKGHGSQAGLGTLTEHTDCTNCCTKCSLLVPGAGESRVSKPSTQTPPCWCYLFTFCLALIVGKCWLLT